MNIFNQSNESIGYRVRTSGSGKVIEEGKIGAKQSRSIDVGTERCRVVLRTVTQTVEMAYAHDDARIDVSDPSADEGSGES
jgi:hypothetical protein